jgi:S-adenosylmethionine:tRNA ribosyltransferase-isomerase
VAAPTASLHFDDVLMQKIKDKNIKTAFITLHVGGGTFLPVKTDNILEHKMHSEMMSVNAKNADIINQTKVSGGRIIAIGTTALRCLESAADKKGILQSVTKDTDIFITPSYKFKMVDILLTNFHLPKSTLFMLVCALCGIKTMHHAYAAAQEQKYRFFSYGDSCLLFKS